jgi:hypothetical protein
MANVESQFLEFDRNIKLDFDENTTLKEKRDIVLEKLRVGLKRDFSARGKEPPSFVWFDQGSYAMSTGVKPTEDDFDIDVGIVFLIKKSEYPDPVVVKGWVLSALEGHTDRVEMRRPCVTVFYHKYKEPVYHVDLAIYVADPMPTASTKISSMNLFLARGTANSVPEHREWQPADPKTLIDLIEDKFSNGEKAQFKRGIRAIKRWARENFDQSSNGCPTGIALTVDAYRRFQPVGQYDAVKKTTTWNDLEALERWVKSMLSNFGTVVHDGEVTSRLQAKLPVNPGSDMYGRLSNAQMKTFKAKLETLRDALVEARLDPDVVSACKKLQKVFGEDFPVPDAKETAKAMARAIIPATSSA